MLWSLRIVYLHALLNGIFCRRTLYTFCDNRARDVIADIKKNIYSRVPVM